MKFYRIEVAAMKRLVLKERAPIRKPTFLYSSTANVSSSSSVKDRAKTDFGFQEVGEDEKEGMVRDVFTRVAARYDIMNDLMSAGTHRLWKDDLIGMMGYGPAAKGSPEKLPRHLDVAGGTGDVAFRSLEALCREFSSHPIIQASNQSIDTSSATQNSVAECPVVVCDINPDMLRVGKQRSKALPRNTGSLVQFVEGNAECLPFESNSFDIYTIAFGLRNVTHKDAALKEAYRVLRPGGRLLVMEFSHLVHPVLQKAYDQYSFNVIPWLGEVISSDRASYQYLVESIRKFPRQEELLKMLQEGGFSFCSYKNLSLGIVAIHSGFKL